MIQEGYSLSDEVKEYGQTINRHIVEESNNKHKRKSSKKKKKNLQKIRMDQLSSVYCNSNQSFTPRSSTKNKLNHINYNQSPRVGTSVPSSRRKMNGNSLISQNSLLHEQTQEAITNLYSTFDAVKVAEIFQQNKYISKSTRNFEIPQTMKKQVEQNKLRVSQERYKEYDTKMHEILQQNKQPEYQFSNRKSSKKMNANLSVIPSNTPSTSSEAFNKEDISEKSQLSPQSFINRETDQKKNSFDLYTANSQIIESTRNKSSTQQPIYNALLSKHRSLSFNYNSNSQKSGLYQINQSNQPQNSNTNEINLRLSDSISNYPTKKSNWEEEFIGMVQDDEKDLNKSSYCENSYLRQSSLNKEGKSGSRLFKFSMESITFTNQDNIERLKKKLVFKPREFIPLGTKYSFQSQDGENSVYFKSQSQTPKVVNYKTKQFNEGQRETSPNLQKKISRRFFDKYQNNSMHIQGINNKETQDFDINKVKEKTIQIKKSTQQLQFFPWRLNQIMQEREKQEQELKMNRFEFDTTNQSHKLPPQKQQRELDNRFKRLMQNTDVRKQLDEINKMINKQKHVAQKDIVEQLPKTVRFLHQTTQNYEAE